MFWIGHSSFPLEPIFFNIEVIVETLLWNNGHKIYEPDRIFQLGWGEMIQKVNYDSEHIGCT